MKFSFNYKEYRHNLAHELKDKRGKSKNSAKEHLKQEKLTTPNYDLSKRLRLIDKPLNLDLQKIKNATGDKLEKTENTTDYKKEVFDISNLIPNELKVYFDQVRLLELKSKINANEKWKKHLDIDPKLIPGYHEELDERSLGAWEKRKLYRPSNWRELEKTAKDLVNKITQGALNDPQKFNHVLGGGRPDLGIIKTSEVSLPENATPILHTISPISITNSRKKLEIIVPESSGFTKDKPKKIENSELYVAAGGTNFFNSALPVIIFDPKSKRFNSRCSFEIVIDDNFKPIDLVGALERANNHREIGILLNIHGKNVTFEDIAEWIVDLPNGIAIHLTDTNGSE